MDTAAKPSRRAPIVWMVTLASLALVLSACLPQFSGANQTEIVEAPSTSIEDAITAVVATLNQVGRVVSIEQEQRFVTGATDGLVDIVVTFEAAPSGGTRLTIKGTLQSGATGFGDQVGRELEKFIAALTPRI